MVSLYIDDLLPLEVSALPEPLSRLPGGLAVSQLAELLLTSQEVLQPGTFFILGVGPDQNRATAKHWEAPPQQTHKSSTQPLSININT